jgi:hypothetical protein
MKYDPIPALQSLKVPALFIFGDDDQLVPVPESISIIRGVLTKSGDPDFTIQLLHGAAHNMRLTSGESAGDIDPEYLATMQKWLAAHLTAPH